MKRLDLITIGRAGVDLYGAQVGGRLEDMGSFAKYIGGSPTDTAGGTARLGLRSAVITRGAVSGSPSSAKLVQSVQHSSRQLPKVRTRFWVNLTPAARAIRASVVLSSVAPIGHGCREEPRSAWAAPVTRAGTAPRANSDADRWPDRPR